MCVCVLLYMCSAQDNGGALLQEEDFVVDGETGTAMSHLAPRGGSGRFEQFSFQWYRMF